MKILCIGDIMGRIGRDMVFEYMERVSSDIDLVIANAENAAHGRGLSAPVYSELKKAGIDGFTLGNHAWGCPDVVRIMKNESDVIRPANFEGECPGTGTMILKTKSGISVGVINLIGRTYMQPAASPFFVADEAIKELKKRTDVILVDFHAEATSEKMAMGFYLDGRVSAVFGTHTHVQTADEHILPKGTAFISDLGMTGPVDSVLGMQKTPVIRKFLSGMPNKFEVAIGKGQFCAAVIEINEADGKAVGIERIFKH